MVECTGLENRRARKGSGGSNPPSSATDFVPPIHRRLGIPIALGFMLFASLAGCASLIPDLVKSSVLACETPKFEVDADFSGGAMAACNVIDDTTIEIVIRPEDAEINPSPWYAVAVTPMDDASLSLQITYEGGKHRYRPKIATMRNDWRRIDPARVSVSEDGLSAFIELPSQPLPYFVAGQEIIDNEDYDRWIDAVSTRSAGPGVSVSQLGRSVEGRAIRALTTRTDVLPRKTVILVGRQHPPELTGALAMRRFVETVFGDADLARAFRNRFDVIVVPNMNPDGVEHGHWRHNINGIDLNRDWGPFTQPETQAVKTVIDRIGTDEKNEMVLFLDFHSTRRNVFYTQTKAEEPTAYDFTGEWMARSRARLPNYDFERAERISTDERPTSKNYMFQRFNIPAITYELGDETDRAQIDLSARVFAEEMMRLLLAPEAG